MWFRQRLDIRQYYLQEMFKIHLRNQGRNEELSAGYCRGLEALWGYSKLTGTESQFFKNIQKIIGWDKKQDIDFVFEKVMGQIEWLQRKASLLNLKQANLEESMQLVTGDNQPALQKEYMFSFMLREEELEKVLGEVVKEGKIVHLGSHNHSIAVILEDGKYKFYDSNNSSGVEEFKTLKSFIRNRNGLLSSIIFENERIETTNKNQKIKYIPLEIEVTDLAGRPMGQYIDPNQMIDELLKARQKQDSQHAYAADIDVTSWDNVTGLWMACRANDYTVAKRLLELGADPNKGDKDNVTPFHNAAMHSLRFFDLLFSYGGNLDSVSTNKKGERFTIRMSASESNDPRIVPYIDMLKAMKKDDVSQFTRLMKENPGLEDIKPDTGSTWLHKCIEAGATEIVKYLINENIVDLRTTNAEGIDAKDFASAKSTQNMFELVESGELIQAIYRKDKDNVISLLSHTDMNKIDLDAILNVAIKQYDPKIFNKILAEIEINDTSHVVDVFGNAIHLAIRMNNVEALKKLFEKAKSIDENINIDNFVDRTNNTPLLRAVEYADLPIIQYLLDNKASLEKVNNAKEGILHRAAHNKDGRILEHFLTSQTFNDLDINAKDAQGKTLLHVVATTDNANLIEILLKRGAVVDKTNSGLTPLHMTLPNRNYKSLVALIKHGEKLDVKNEYDESIANLIAHRFSEKKAIKLIKLLRKKNFDFEEVSMSKKGMLHYAAYQSRGNKLLKYLLKNFKFNVNDADVFGKTPLFYAIESNNLSAIKFLLKNGAKTDIKDNEDNNLLHIAAQCAQKDVFEYLLKKMPKTQVNEKTNMGETPLCIAVITNKESDIDKFREMTSQLIKNGADILIKNDNNETPLDLLEDDKIRKNHLFFTSFIYAMENNDIPRLNELIKNGFDIRSQDSEGNNALHIAIKQGNDKAIDYLLDIYKDNINQPNYKKNETPLILACHKNDARLVKKLIEYGAYIHAKANKHETALHVAAQNSNQEIMMSLIKAGANINSPMIDGTTPLHLAILNNDADTVKFLLKKGADPYVYNNSDQDALALAKLAKNDELVAIFEGRKQNPSLKNNQKINDQVIGQLKKFHNHKYMASLAAQLELLPMNSDTENYKALVIKELDDVMQKMRGKMKQSGTQPAQSKLFSQSNSAFADEIQKCIEKLKAVTSEEKLKY